MEGQIDTNTAPYNPRFPNQNQTKHCWASYVDYHGCVKHYDGDESNCQAFFQSMSSLCPQKWISDWDESKNAGVFPTNRF